MSEIATVASWLRAARSVAVITGAGISAESGVPTFRGTDGLWRSFRAEDLATPEAFERNPELVWEWYRWRREKIAAAQPNAGHHVLARLESRIPDFLLLTQNVDGLHARAGSRRLVELHGNIWRSRCTKEAGRVFDESRQSSVISRQSLIDVELTDKPAPAAAATSESSSQRPRPELGGGAPSPEKRAAAHGDGGGAPSATDKCPSCPSCGALLRPDVVWFGEALDPVVVNRAIAAVERCDVLLLVGTSGVVYPVAGFPLVARRRGAHVVEINVEATPLSDVAHTVLRGTAGTLLPAVEAAL
jgi:NAD-dependent SIR2 family protein deacetylase